MESQGHAQLDEESGSDLLDPILRDPLGVLVRRWKPMLLIGLTSILVAVLVSARMEPRFSAQATVSVIGARISENFIQSTVEIGTLDQINAIISEVLSRKNLAEIALEHDLAEKTVEGEETIEEVVERLRGQIDIVAAEDSVKTRRRRGQSAQIYALGFRDTDAERAAAVSNALASSFIDVHLRMRSSEARVTTDFLRRELLEVEEELRAQERLATEFKEKYRGELPGELDTNLARLERLQENRRVLVEQLRVLESRPVSVEAAVSDDSPEARTLVLRTRLNEALQLYTPDHPNVVALRRQLDVLEEQTAAAGGSGGVGGVSNAGILRRRLAGVERELADLDARVARTPKRQEEQEALDRRLAVLRDNYTELLRKVDQAELSESVESAQHGVRVSILDRAVPPKHRDASRSLVLAIGLGAALALAALVALLLEYVDAVVINADQIESRYAIPVIGNAPHIS